MFVDFQKDATLHRVFRGLRLVRGKRGQWLTNRTVAYLSIAIYERKDGVRAAFLYGNMFYYELPNWRVWTYLFDRWKHEHAKSQRI